MNNMIGNWEDSGKTESQRFFDLARAYLAASLDVSRRIESGLDSRTWSNACVALMTAAHGVELFLKGALITKKIERWGHTINDLLDEYNANFTDEKFAFDCPFVTEFLGFSDKVAARENIKVPLPSILYRYPVNKPGLEWNGAFAFMPEKFIEEIESLDQFIQSVWS